VKVLSVNFGRKKTDGTKRHEKVAAEITAGAAEPSRDFDMKTLMEPYEAFQRCSKSEYQPKLYRNLING
jgi:hypothetical protein